MLPGEELDLFGDKLFNGKGGCRPPVRRERMLRMYIAQQCFG
jgi:hypothetical protein